MRNVYAISQPWWMHTDVLQSPCSKVPLFTSPYVFQSRCSPTLYSLVPILSSPSLPPAPVFPTMVSQSLCFSVSSPYICPSHTISSQEVFYTSTCVFQRCQCNHNVPHSLCSPVLMISGSVFNPYVFQRHCPYPMFPSPYIDMHKVLQTRSSQESFSIPYVPQRYDPVPVCSSVLFVPSSVSESLSSPKIFSGQNDHSHIRPYIFPICFPVPLVPMFCRRFLIPSVDTGWVINMLVTKMLK